MSHRLAFAALALLALPGVAHAQSQLRANDTLRDNQRLTSPSGAYHVVMQSDCNLVLYQGSRSLWASASHGGGDGCFAIMQEDGNVVVYNAANQALWASNTTGGRDTSLVVQDDGNLVVTSGGRALWSSDTHVRPPEPPRPPRPEPPRPPSPPPWTGGGGWGGGGQERPWQGADVLRSGDELSGNREEFIESSQGTYRLTLRQSCELEVTQGSSWNSRQRWRAGTAYAGRSCRLVMRNAGELVVIADGRTVWGTATSGRDVIAFVNRDGNLILYDRDRNREVFNSRRDYGRRY